MRLTNIIFVWTFNLDSCSLEVKTIDTIMHPLLLLYNVSLIEIFHHIVTDIVNLDVLYCQKCITDVMTSCCKIILTVTTTSSAWLRKQQWSLAMSPTSIRFHHAIKEPTTFQNIVKVVNIRFLESFSWKWLIDGLFQQNMTTCPSVGIGGSIRTRKTPIIFQNHHPNPPQGFQAFRFHFRPVHSSSAER